MSLTRLDNRRGLVLLNFFRSRAAVGSTTISNESIFDFFPGDEFFLTKARSGLGDRSIQMGGWFIAGFFKKSFVFFGRDDDHRAVNRNRRSGIDVMFHFCASVKINLFYAASIVDEKDKSIDGGRSRLTIKLNRRN